MAIGRTFKESIQKALRSLEIGARGFGGGGKAGGRRAPDDATIKTKLGTPNAERIFYIRYAFRAGYTVEQIFDLTKIDPWFLHQLREIHEMEEELAGPARAAAIRRTPLRRAKQFGFSDAQLAHLLSDLAAVRADRASGGASGRRSGSSTPAPRSSRRSRPTTIPATATRTRSCPRRSARS
jgi:carbamoyl-phosphate synthase large subunit